MTQQAKQIHTPDWTRDPFFRVNQSKAATTEGDVELPILYFDTSNTLAFFTASHKAARALLQGTGLKPAVRLGGQTLVGMSFYEYRQTSVGAYNEVGLAIPVVGQKDKRIIHRMTDLLRPAERRDMAFYVVDLPVTTELANAAGRQIWGYPKFVTAIDYGMKRGRLAMAVHDPEDDTTICTLEGRTLPGLPTPPLDLVTYTMLDQERLRTEVNVRGWMKARLPVNARLRVGKSRHHMAEHLRALELDGKRPLFIMDTDHFQSRLNRGVPG